MIIHLTKEELIEIIDKLEYEITLHCLHFERDLVNLNGLIEDFKKELGL